MKYLTVKCVICGGKFRFWTLGKLYPIVCEDCFKAKRGK